jgi:predicted secreted protein
VLSIPTEIDVEPHRPAWAPRPRIVARRPESWARPAHPGDIAQARVFDALLLGEIAELQELAASMERRWRRRCERGIDDYRRPPENLAKMRARVAEAQKLLDGLRNRFPTD